MNEYLSVRNLTVEYVTSEETVYAVNDVSFSMEKGRTLGLVGETGAGKTTIARSIMRILPVPPAVVKNGEIFLNGRDLMKLSKKEMYAVRGDEVSMIFQDPMTSLNPTMHVGDQIAEVILHHESVSKAEARKKAETMLEMVGIPKERYDEFPHQFSGGMKQRVVIAIALACDPDVLIADEPTTALDVTIQAQVLEMMRDLRNKKNMSLILITHDLGVVAEMCDDVAVVYGGEIVEKGTLAHIFKNPSHPYTIGLFGAIPDLESDRERLTPIKGQPINPAEKVVGCKFRERCPYATEACGKGAIPDLEIEPGHFSKCLYKRKEG